MKTTVMKRLARLASLLVLALVAFAVVVQAALASVVEGTGAPAGPAIVTPAAASSSTMPTAAWIVLAAAAGVLLIISEWALVRGVQRRRAPAESPAAETFCTQNPSSGLCKA